MKKKSIFSFVSSGILVLVFAVFMFSWPLPATSPAKSLRDSHADVYLIGILDPDDRKHVWALPAEAATGIGRRLAANYPSKSIDGVTFYRVGSWRDTANLAIEAHAQQGILIVDLVNQIDRLKKSGPDRKLTRRVTALEKRLNKILEPSNP
jgi:hypothetical protein